MSEIAHLHAREILDSRGNPTVEVEVLTADGQMARAAVPSGASTGKHEALELRDGDRTRFGGKGVLKAVAHVNEKLAPELLGFDVTQQTLLDQTLIEMDGTDNKGRFGANAILGVSLACAKVAAQCADLPLYQYLGGVRSSKLPVPLMNVLNGGAHANNGLDIQEFMIVPVMDNFRETLRAGSEIFQTLKKILNDKHLSTGVGDEGGFAPVLKSNQEALDLLMAATEKAGYKAGENVFFALDVAATELFEDGRYRWQGGQLSAEELAEIYRGWAKQYPLVSIEDGFAEDDWSGWVHFTNQMGETMQIVGDDLFVTNPKRLAEGIARGAANALLVKINQIGTLTETGAAVHMAQHAGFETVMSHRSGETEDVAIADLAVGFSCSQIKTGSLCRGERINKYNQLLRIEEELGDAAQFWGLHAFSRHRRK